MKTFVLRAWAAGDTPPQGTSPLELFESTPEQALRSVASHGHGVLADSAFVWGNEDRDLAMLLDPNNLSNPPLLAAAGDDLYQRLALGQVGAALGNIPPGSRVLLDLRSAALEHLPWEFLRCNNLALFCSGNQPWSRGQVEAPMVPNPLQAVDSDPPLRVLVLVGDDPMNSTVQADVEVQCIEDALQSCATQVLLQVLVRPQATELTEMLRDFRPHVFHFIGHGATLKNIPVLCVWSDALQTTDTWDANRLRLVLQSSAVPRLVVLNACNTAQPLGSWDLASAFVGAGVNAVLAMQAQIAGTAAATFGKSLYEKLVEGVPVDAAVAWARHTVAMSSAADGGNWPIPRLVVRGDVDQVLPRAKRQRVPRPKLRATDDFVDRSDQRKQAWDTLCPSKPGQPRLVVVEGPPRSGKTEFLQMLGETWIQTWDYEAVPVNLGGPETSALARIQICTTKALSAAKLNFDPLERIAPDLDSDALCRAVRGALEECGTPGKLLLVLLDGLEEWEPNMAKIALELFCVAYASPDERSQVRLAVALPTELSRRIAWRDDYGIEPIQVDDFSPLAWARTAPPFIRFHSRKHGDATRDRFETAAWAIAGIPQPGTLGAAPPQNGPFKAKLLRAIRDTSHILAGQS